MTGSPQARVLAGCSFAQGSRFRVLLGRAIQWAFRDCIPPSAYALQPLHNGRGQPKRLRSVRIWKGMSYRSCHTE
jgi:hypothetical protein